MQRTATLILLFTLLQSQPLAAERQAVRRHYSPSLAETTINGEYFQREAAGPGCYVDWEADTHGELSIHATSCGDFRIPLGATDEMRLDSSNQPVHGDAATMAIGQLATTLGGVESQLDAFLRLDVTEPAALEIATGDGIDGRSTGPIDFRMVLAADAEFHFAPGDVTRDGQVDFQDFLPLARNYGQADRSWRHGDMTGDGKVDLQDLLRFQQQFGAHKPITLSSVPEPIGGAMIVGALPIVWLLRRHLSI